MENEKVDQNPAGLDDGQKSPVEPGSGNGGADVAGLKAKIEELLTEKKSIAAKLAKAEQAEQKRIEEEAKKRGDFEALVTAREAELAEARERIKLMQIESKAKDAGLIDADYLSLIAGQVDDDMANLPEIMAELREKKPYLFRQQQTAPLPPNVDRSKGSHPQPGKVFHVNDVASMSQAEYEKHREQILESHRLGGLKTN